jgi:hypothetical protein
MMYVVLLRVLRLYEKIWIKNTRLKMPKFIIYIFLDFKIIHSRIVIK